MKPRKLIAKGLVLVLLSILTITGWTKDKGHPATDAVAESSTKKCDITSGSATLNPKIFASPLSDFTLLPAWTWSGSGFNNAIPSIEANSKQAYIFHLTTWNLSVDGASLNSSSWYVYHYNGAQMKQSYRTTTTESLPFLYGDSSILLVSVQKVQAATADAPKTIVKSSYKLTVKQKAPQNITNLIAVGEALLGVSGAAKAEAAGIPACVETFSVHGGHPPYDLTAEASFEFSGPPKPGGAPTEENVLPSPTGPSDEEHSIPAQLALPNPTPTSTPGKAPSGISRTFSILDKEYWDVNLGLNLPSVDTPIFTLSKDNKVQESISKKVSPYAFVSLYPFAAVSPKDGAWPHINLGLPVAGQPLHRPFAGVAEKIPWLDRYTGIPISVFAGAVALKESISTLPLGLTTTPDQFVLRSHWVWKGMFGLEFPVSSLISKIGKK